MYRSHWQDWLVIVIGVILFTLPFVSSYALPAGASPNLVRAAFVVVGLAAVFLGAVGAASEAIWEEWALIALGALLFVAPWLLGFGGAGLPKWVALAAGIATVLLAGLSIAERRSDI